MSAGQLTSPHQPLHLSHGLVVAGVVVLAVAAIATTGLVLQRATAPADAQIRPTYHAGDPAPGEFLLAPGNLSAIGVTVALPPDSYPWPNEYRLAPGNLTPPGIMRPSRPSVDPSPIRRYAPGEFGLAPGNLPAVGVVVPVQPVIRAARGAFWLGAGNTQPPGITVPLEGTAG
jgi:hypothetical protein